MKDVLDPRPSPPSLAPEMALFLDVDGALIEFAHHPDAVVVPTALRARLAALQVQLDGAIALISGRSIETLDALFAPLRLPCAGLHGVQRRNAEGVLTDAPSPHAALARLRDLARHIAAKYPGTVVEDKGAALALHWRADPLAASDFEAFAATALMELDGYRMQQGDHVLELHPDGASKGSAVRAFLREHPFEGRTPVFIGDDLTDEFGFEAVNENDGISILVGTRAPSAAHYVLEDVASVNAWLGVSKDNAA